MTSHMHAHLSKCGYALLIDDNRSGINTGFAFWSVILIDSDGNATYAIGSMTMTCGYDDGEWILTSMLEIDLQLVQVKIKKKLKGSEIVILID